MTQVLPFEEWRALELAPGVSMRPLFGEKTMINLLDFEPNAFVPEHDHPHEQLGMVISGEVVLTIDGEEHRLAPFCGYEIRGGARHSALAGPEGCRLIDVFAPVREDYLERSRNAR